ncbi:MAG: FkbM family methyltransferase [Pseudomonadota bacterium]
MEVVEIHGVKMPVDPAVMPEKIAERMRAGKYEKAEVTALGAILREGDRVLDLGAGFGLTSTFAALQSGVEAVTTFEANPNILDHLGNTHRLNGVDVQIEHAVLSSKGGGDTVEFYVRPLVWGSSLFENKTKGQKVTVKTRDLAETIAALRPSVICCDIEGAEYDVLMNADLSSVRAIVVELHPRIIGAEKTAAIERRLKAEGFRLKPEFSSDNTVAYHRDASGGLPAPGLMTRIRGMFGS